MEVDRCCRTQGEMIPELLDSTPLQYTRREITNISVSDTTTKIMLVKE